MGQIEFLKDRLRKVRESELSCRPQNPLGGGSAGMGSPGGGLVPRQTWPWLETLGLHLCYSSEKDPSVFSEETRQKLESSMFGVPAHRVRSLEGSQS